MATTPRPHIRTFRTPAKLPANNDINLPNRSKKTRVQLLSPGQNSQTGVNPLCSPTFRPLSDAPLLHDEATLEEEKRIEVAELTRLEELQKRDIENVFLDFFG